MVFENGLKKSPAEAGPRQPRGHLRAFATLSKAAVRFVPTSFTAVMMTTAMPAAMSPYSIAVAPDSFLRKFAKSLFIGISPSFVSKREAYYQCKNIQLLISLQL